MPDAPPGIAGYAVPRSSDGFGKPGPLEDLSLFYAFFWN
jgi:hypothetical protein